MSAPQVLPDAAVRGAGPAFGVIVCAVDLTESAGPVIAVAASLARALAAKLELLHVLHLPPGLPVEQLAENVIVDLRLAASNVMEARAAELRDAGLDVGSRVVLGRVDDGILERAGEVPADLLVLGTHARHGASRLFLGSVAERVVKKAVCPVVVVPPTTAGRLASGAPLAGALRIVAGIDPSPASDAALAWLRVVDDQVRCDVRLVHFYWPPREHERLGLGWPDPLVTDRGVLGVLTHELKRQVSAQFGRDDVSLTVRPYWGAEESPLVAEAGEDDADLLVVGTSQGRHSTAIAAVRSARIPVVCVPNALSTAAAGPLRPLRTVLVTTDLSPLGDAAVPEAYRLLLRGGGEVVLFHAAEPGSTGLGPERRSQLEGALRALVPDGLDGLGIRTTTSVAADRSPGEAILKAIQRIDPDVVVMSSHGRSGVRRAVRGSVAEHVTRAAAKPVLIVPAPPEASGPG